MKFLNTTTSSSQNLGEQRLCRVVSISIWDLIKSAATFMRFQILSLTTPRCGCSSKFWNDGVWMTVISLSLFFLLTGCSQYSETFDCGVGQGVGCKSLTYVNKQVEKGQLPYEEEEEASNAQEKKVVPLDLKPRGQRVWIAEYTDEDGTVHEPSYVRMR